MFLVGVSCKWQTVNDSVFIDINKTMKRFLTTVLLFVVASVLLHCNAQALNTNVVSAQNAPETTPTFKRLLTREQLEAMGINWNKLLKHIKLQKVAWNGGDFRDDQSEPRYEPTREDFLLTIPLVEYYMRTHGYQKPSDELFAQRIHEVFGAKLNMQSQQPYLPIQGEADYNFASTYYALCGKGIITYNWLLDDLMDVRTNKIVLRPKIFQQILALNNFVMYNDTAAFKFLTQATYSGHEDDYNGMGDPYDGNNILCDLFSTYNYYGSAQLNQWYFTTQDVNPVVFYHLIFERTPQGKLVAHRELIELIEQNTTGTNTKTYWKYFGELLFDVLDNEDDFKDMHYSVVHKAKMLCYFANSEHKMRKRYAKYIPSLTTTAYWDRSSTTASMIMQHPDVYNMACKYNYFGVVKPEVMKEYAAEAERMKKN